MVNVYFRIKVYVFILTYLITKIDIDIAMFRQHRIDIIGIEKVISKHH